MTSFILLQCIMECNKDELEVIHSIQPPATYHKRSSVVLCMWVSNVGTKFNASTSCTKVPPQNPQPTTYELSHSIRACRTVKNPISTTFGDFIQKLLENLRVRLTSKPLQCTSYTLCCYSSCYIVLDS